MKVDVDIIILTYNGIGLIKDCVESLLNQSVTPNNIIIVDNGSNDGTSDFISKNFPNINLLKIENNIGIPRAFNKAIRLCNSKYVAWLNNDITLDKNWLKETAYFIKDRPNVASCDSLVLYDDDRSIVWSMGAAYNIMGSAKFINQGLTIGDIDQTTCKKIIATVGCAAIYRRSIFDSIGELDESFFLGFEDVDWSLRATIAGYQNYNIPSAIVYHKVSQTVVIGSEQYVRCGQRNVTATFIKNMPRGLIFIFTPMHILYQILAFIYYITKGRGWSFVQAKKDNLRLFSEYLRKRREVQSNKSISIVQFLKLLSFNTVSNKFKMQRGKK
jgi:GT2 family glycosyltransferase